MGWHRSRQDHRRHKGVELVKFFQSPSQVEYRLYLIFDHLTAGEVAELPFDLGIRKAMARLLGGSELVRQYSPVAQCDCDAVS